MKQKNLIWIVVDSVRSYKTGRDDRDRLDVMDEFAKESVEFTNAYTSAPSSILSGAAMFTGMPSCFISRHFNDWQFDSDVILSLQNVLSENGYTNYAIHNSKEDREVMKDLILPIERKYFAKGISHGKWWTNLQINQILKKILDNGASQPSFYMLWYDCRKDPDTSDIVKNAFTLFKKQGLYDNSVLVVTSDHGYPDPKSELREETMRNATHDIIVTDDNVKIPLFIRCSGIAPRKVDKLVGTIDLFPTILNLLDITCSDPRMKYVKGIDLRKLMEGGDLPFDDRVIRIDTRLTMAPGRVTALRSRKYKYVYYHEENEESLYDMENDPMEFKDLLVKPSGEASRVGERFRSWLEKSQDELNRFHADELRGAFEKNIKKIKLKNLKRLIFMSNVPTIFLDIVSRSFRKGFPGIRIDILLHKAHSLDDKGRGLFDDVITLVKVNSEHVRQALKEKRLNGYDLALLITEKSTIIYQDQDAYQASKELSKKILMVDFNMKFYSRFLSRWVWPLRKYKRNWEFYRQEPGLLIQDVVKLARLGLKYLVLNKPIETPEMDKVKKMRDRAMLARKTASLKDDIL